MYIYICIYIYTYTFLNDKPVPFELFTSFSPPDSTPFPFTLSGRVFFYPTLHSSVHYPCHFYLTYTPSWSSSLCSRSVLWLAISTATSLALSSDRCCRSSTYLGRLSIVLLTPFRSSLFVRSPGGDIQVSVSYLVFYWRALCRSTSVFSLVQSCLWPLSFLFLRCLFFMSQYVSFCLFICGC